MYDRQVLSALPPVCSAGELPVLLAVEAQRGHKLTVLAETAVMTTLLTHRLHELQSTGGHALLLTPWANPVLMPSTPALH